MSRAAIRLTKVGLASLVLLLPACARSFTRPVGESDLADGSGGSSGGHSGDIAGQNGSGSYFWYVGGDGDTGGSGYAGGGYAGGSRYGYAGGYAGYGGYGAYGGWGNYCGDGIINADGEQCDGTDLDGMTCGQLGMGTGDLACYTASCTFDTSLCVPDDYYPPPGPTPVPPPYPRSYPPDYPPIQPPGTPEECVELYFNLQSAIPFVIPEPNLDFLCDTCLDEFGPCLADYYCTQIVSCCHESGHLALSCVQEHRCVEIIEEAQAVGSGFESVLAPVVVCIVDNWPPAP